MIKNFLFTFVLVSMYPGVFGQDPDHSLKGKVSFITSQNVYVKFGNTRQINIGDTLEISGEKRPCLIVREKSSSSCVCIIINECPVNINDEIIHISKTRTADPAKDEVTENKIPLLKPDSINSRVENPKSGIYHEKIKGKISLSSYNNISDSRDNRHRVLSRFSLNADHINNSKVSFESYLFYKKNIPELSSENPDNNNFKIYNLAVKYDLNPSLSLSFGRKINPKMSSVGAIDGLQIENRIGKNYVGAISGFRPDIFNYGLNLNLFEFGGYIGRATDNENFRSQTSLGILEQKNSGKTDRRYTYFQHSSTILKKLSLFSSVEFDIYNKMSDSLGSDVRLTNLYLSARYRFSRKFDVTLSYDSRKRILYYETFQTEIERILDDDLARQGFKIRANVKPLKYVSLGISLSKRFQSDSQNESNNLYAYTNLSKIPGIGGRLSVNYNFNTTNYLENKVLSIRHSRMVFKDKLYADLYYRNAKYKYLNSERESNLNHYYGGGFSFHLDKNLMLKASYEVSDFNRDKNYRFNAGIIKRFRKNKK